MEATMALGTCGKGRCKVKGEREVLLICKTFRVPVITDTYNTHSHDILGPAGPNSRWKAKQIPITLDNTDLWSFAAYTAKKF